MLTCAVDKNLAEAFCTIMWLWVFYRTKEDGAKYFLGKHPWDYPAEVDDYDFYGLSRPSEIEYEKGDVGEIPKVIVNS